MPTADLPAETVMAAKQPEGLRSAPEMPDLDAVDVLSLTDTGSPGSVWTECRDTCRDTLLVFDWDDTLLSTAAINRGAWTEPQLKTLLRTVEAVLREAVSLGETIIVTNGNATWVQDSARAYLPELSPLLDEIKVISARAKHEQEHPGNPFAWKRRAFSELMAPWMRAGVDEALEGDGDDRSPAVNLVVLGDSMYEMEAAESLKGGLSAGSLVKCVKFVETPAIDTLIGELRRVLQELPFLVAGEHSRSLNLLRSMRHVASDLAAWCVVDKDQFDKQRNAPWVPEVDTSKDTQILPAGLMSWVHHLGDQLLCKEPSYLGQFEEAYEEATLKEHGDFRSYLGSATPFATPWQH